MKVIKFPKAQIIHLFILFGQYINFYPEYFI